MAGWDDLGNPYGSESAVRCERGCFHPGEGYPPGVGLSSLSRASGTADPVGVPFAA